MYYDRGELFAYLPPCLAAGVISGGPFGVNQSPPYVNVQSCTDTPTLYLGFVPTCNSATAADPFSTVTPFGANFQNPWGGTLGPLPSGNPALLNLPNEHQIENFAQLFSFAVYNRKNKLPYTMNQTLDIQWQPRNDLAIDIGYVGNLGRHEIVPVPFNQALIASPSSPVRPGTPFEQDYSYGYTVGGATLPNGQAYEANFEGGNIDLRVPFIGYSSESLS